MMAFSADISTKSRIKIVKELLNHPDIEVNRTALPRLGKMTAFHFACIVATEKDTNNLTSFKILVNHTNLDVNVQTTEGTTGLMLKFIFQGQSARALGIKYHPVTRWTSTLRGGGLVINNNL